MAEIFWDALIDSAKMIPWLFIIYMGIEYLESQFGGQIRQKVKQAGKAGPLLGALFGCVPQCGFSVISTALYSSRVITLGTLLAVYLSTSDEALPVILAQPDKAGVIVPLLLTKVVIAVVAGYTIDFVFHHAKHPLAGPEVSASAEDAHEHLLRQDAYSGGEIGCCGHSCTPERLEIRELLGHPVRHTLKVFFFVFTVSFLLNGLIFQVGEKRLSAMVLGNSFLQPILAALVGLIPNCAASVVITQLYLKGAISFGSTIAGLSSGAGLGLIVLFKENRNWKDTLRVVGLLLGFSILFGIIIQTFFG